MVTRRTLILSGTAWLLASLLPRHTTAVDDPAAICTRVAKGKGDSGGTVRDAGQWKIDDSKGAVDGSPWSVRAILAASFK
jgi:hypothetical protein